jgi:hypothetical protein
MNDLGVSFIQGFYVDNSGNANAITFNFPDTNQIISIPPSSQGFVPVLSMGFQVNVNATTNTATPITVTIQLLNMPTQLAIWNSLSSSSGFKFDGSGNLDVNIQSGGGSGGTASNFSAAFPATGTAAGQRASASPGAQVSGNMVPQWCDLSGNTYVNVAAGSVSQAGTWTVQQGGAPWSVTGSGNFAVTQSGAWSISLAAQTTGGMSSKAFIGGTGTALLSNTVTAVKSSAAGTLYGLSVYNPNGSVAYVQSFDVATAGAVTLGTTVPNESWPVPANGWYDVPINDIGLLRANGIQLAATTTATGSTALGTGLTVHVFYK